VQECAASTFRVEQYAAQGNHSTVQGGRVKDVALRVSQWELRTSDGDGDKTAKEKAGKNKRDEKEKERKILYPAYLFSTTSSLAMLALPALCLPLTRPQRHFLSTSVNLTAADSSTL